MLKSIDHQRTAPIGTVRSAILIFSFAACVPLANWLIHNAGVVCIPAGPCLIPVAPDIMAPTGVLAVGLALVLRDLVQYWLGLRWALLSILIGAVFSIIFAEPALIFASALAFLLSEIADLFVYTPLQKRGFFLAIIASGLVGLIVDSVVFLYVAFGSLEFLPGQVLGKLWVILAAVPILRWIRSRRSVQGAA